MDEATRHPQARKRRALGRGIYILPSLFTVGSLVCGYYAILSTLRGALGMASPPLGADLSFRYFDAAAKALGWAVLLDSLDGRIARLTNSTSDFGREFDSLADVISFGVAPAFLAFAWGVRPVEQVVSPQWFQHVHQIGWIVTFSFLICGAARLARFNIQTVRPDGDKRHFVGLPIPAGAGLVAAVVHWHKLPIHDWQYGLMWLAMVGVAAFLMVSKVRYFSFKSIDWRRRRSYLTVPLMALVAYAVFAWSEYALLLLAASYALSGPVARLAARIRPHPPAPQEVHAA